MARQKNDGKGRLGGRAKGTPNKVSGSLKSWLRKVIEDNKEKFEEEVTDMQGQDFVRVISSLLPFVTPKLQSVTPEQMLDAEYNKLQELLESAPDEVIERVSERIKQIQDDRRAEDGTY